ncbi:hypothetical protein [Reyranella sp. CPCC 100927]|nr:hypothetical protein [Reyranella sp. CPCC 100927]
MRLVLGSLVALILVVGVLLVLDGKKAQAPSTAEVPSDTAPGRTDSPK